MHIQSVGGSLAQGAGVPSPEVRQTVAGASAPEASQPQDKVTLSAARSPEPPRPAPVVAEAMEAHEKLATLTGADREAWIRQYRDSHRGQVFAALHVHNHQPIYRPGVHPADTPEIQSYVLGTGDAENRREVYTTADAYAIEENPGRPDLGFQVSYSGSLMENLDKTAERGQWPGTAWAGRYRNVREGTDTPLGNERLDFVNFGYYHPLMGLIASGQPGQDRDLDLQIRMHQQAVRDHFGGQVSKGFFPPEMAWSDRMIPTLEANGINWTIVDNLHVDRANQGYDNLRDGLKAPNPADRRNPPAEGYETLSNDLAKTHVVSPRALRPHYQKYVDQQTGDEKLVVVVPQERSLSSYIQKDRNGGRVQEVLDRFSAHNTDPEHPFLVLMATDGDNNGSNSGSFHRDVPVDLASRFPGKVSLLTVEDYLAIYPPEKPRLVSQPGQPRRYEGGDVVHVEDGSWWGANLGDPEFSKWIDSPAYKGFSPKDNSWACLTAAKNAVLTADSMERAGDTPESLRNIAGNRGSDTEKAWHGLLVGQTSCYEYWNADNVLSYSSVKGANLALESAGKVIARHDASQDKVGPTVFLPRHTPYNPGGQPGEFEVVTYAYDVHQVKDVKIKFRLDADGKLDRPQDFMLAGGEVAPWSGEVKMDGKPYPDLADRPPVWLDPKARADVYRGTVTIPLPEGKPGAMVQYVVEATDTLGNVSVSPLRNVWVSAEGAPLTNEELHARMGSGDASTVAGAVGYILSQGRDDVNLFNHLFHRLETSGPALLDSLASRAQEGRLTLSDAPAFRDNYVTRLDRYLDKPANVAALRDRAALKQALAGPLDPADARVQRIRERLAMA